MLNAAGLRCIMLALVAAHADIVHVVVCCHVFAGHAVETKKQKQKWNLSRFIYVSYYYF